jgi:hypothetical protein
MATKQACKRLTFVFKRTHAVFTKIIQSLDVSQLLTCSSVFPLQRAYFQSPSLRLEGVLVWIWREIVMRLRALLRANLSLEGVLV